MMTVRSWLAGIDPGLIRLRSAGRAALALLSIWLALRTTLLMLTGEVQPIIPLFGMLAGIVLLLFIIDLRPADRKVSLWLATIPFAGAVLLAGALAKVPYLNNLILLALFFSAYFFRRYGPRAGELALAATVGYYMGLMLKPPPAMTLILLGCVAFSAVMIYLWQFVILPYDPLKYLYSSVRAFYHNTARGVGAVREGLDSGARSSQTFDSLQRNLQQVQRNRRVIEGLFSAIVSPSLWSQARLNQLQEEMFKAERGLELLIEAAGKLSAQRNELPDGILKALQEGLSILEDQLWEMASGETAARLAEAGQRLQALVKPSLAEQAPSEWLFSLQRIGIAARQLAQSVEGIHAIEIARREEAAEQIPTPAAIRPIRGPRGGPLGGLLGRQAGAKGAATWHPTTILGLQAVLATGLAMLAAYLLKMDSPNLVFWTAFVVIAGSTGESLRRITMRVAAVIAGTLIGVGLAVLLPGNLALLVLAVMVCLFMTIYVLPISYFWMVFWLNIAMLLIITAIGAAPVNLLVVRVVSTVVGAASAAVVVTFVLPIRVHKRFEAALSEFMRAVDAYIESYVASLVDDKEAGDLTEKDLKIDASFKKLELTMPNVVYEYNPLTRSQSRLASQGTSLAVLKGYVTNLKDDVGAEPGSVLDPKQAELMRTIQAEIHANLEGLNNSLAQGLSEDNEPRSDSPRQGISKTILEEIAALDGGPIETGRKRAFFHLIRINNTIMQIASGFGLAVTTS